MLEKDEDLRASIADIEAHPWVMRKLPERYETALAKIEEKNTFGASLFIPPLDMAVDVAELVRRGSVQIHDGDPMRQWVDLAPIKLPNTTHSGGFKHLTGLWGDACKDEAGEASTSKE